MSTFIISECGINHGGDLALAKQQIYQSKLAGADAVKFQVYDPYSVLGMESPYLSEAIRAKVNDTAFHYATKAYADEVGIEWFASAFHLWAVDFLESLGVKRHKIASRSFKDSVLVAHIAATNKPVIMSVGSLEDTSEDANSIEKAINILAGSPVALLYCVTKYPTQMSDIDFEKFSFLKRFNKEIGFSSHCPSIWPGIRSVLNGARVLEYHTTISRNLPGCDQSSSLQYDELKMLVDGVRYFEALS